MCRDINLRAEEVYLKVSKKGKYFRLFFVVALVVFTVWNWQWVRNNPWWWAWLGTCALLVFVIYKIQQKMINAMKRAASPKENLRIAKWLKRFIKLIYGIGLIVVYSPWIKQLVHEQRYGLACFVAVLLFVFGFIASSTDATFNEDLHELEYRLEE